MTRRSIVLAVAVFVGLYIGVIAAWALLSDAGWIRAPHIGWPSGQMAASGSMRGSIGTQPGAKGERPRSPTESDGRPVPTAGSAIEDLRHEELLPPIDGMNVEILRGSFEEIHGGHRHEAVDILARRGTPVRAVADGEIAKLFESKAGGHTIYEYDTSGRYTFYYAHLEHYADVGQGDAVRRGEVIGYVGTSGNAPPGTPHLHFAIFVRAPGEMWWQGEPIDPSAVFAH